MYADDPTEDAKTRLENILEFRSEVLEFESGFVGDDIFYDTSGPSEYGEATHGAAEIDSNSQDAGERDTDTRDADLQDADAHGEGRAVAGVRKAALSDFLAHVSLISDLDSYSEADEKVALMTVHSAKGLEYEAVFIVGAEEGIFPGQRSILDRSRLEEERRLCYVAITRAKKRLFITHAASRTLFGNTTYNRLSRFIADIPNKYVSSEIDLRVKSSKYGADALNRSPAPHSRAGRRVGIPAFGKTTHGYAHKQDNGYRAANPEDGAAADPADEYRMGREYVVGDSLNQKKYGGGVITKRYREKSDYIIEIDFMDAGMKRFIESMVKLRV
jgi:DNA helicase-2/ATP-dependent DNA helicase PcrA